EGARRRLGRRTETQWSLAWTHEVHFHGPPPGTLNTARNRCTLAPPVAAADRSRSVRGVW
ncbi:MAG TPA: hypothetical protein VEK07_06175, partial [Polyangiaceae bacterium]|nr:hypothetical protein [Polyangiaceae bacterium]